MTGSRPLIALSIGDSPDLGRRGYGTEHVDAVAVRLADALLNEGYDIAYGGVLRSSGFTETLQRVVKSYENSDDIEEVSEPQPRMVNYLPWPHRHALDAEKTANLLGMCRFVAVDPPGKKGLAAPDQGGEKSPDTIYHAALANSEMRRLMARGTEKATDGQPVPPTAARIVLGGKVTGWSGILPGVAEEVLETLEAETPVYMLGCFGGACRLIGKALMNSEYPEELRKAFHDREEQFQRTESAFKANYRGQLIADRFSELERRLTSALLSDDGRWVDNGLSLDENLELLDLEDVPTIKQYILRGLRSVLTRSAGHD